MARWVINAINRDLPYNQFLIEQLAGDSSPDATQDQKIATGFLRNGMVNEEGAIVAESSFAWRDVSGYVIGNPSRATIQCAQCHTHKYDPLTQEEYYRLMAFINNDYEAITWIYTPEQLVQIKKVNEGIATLEQKIKSEHGDWQVKQLAWEDEARKNNVKWEQLKPVDPEWGGGLSHPERRRTAASSRSASAPATATSGSTPIRGDQPHGLRLEAHHDGDLPFGGPNAARPAPLPWPRSSRRRPATREGVCRDEERDRRLEQPSFTILPPQARAIRTIA